MFDRNSNRKRRVIPRWRTPEDPIALNYVGGRTDLSPTFTDADLERCIDRWRANPSDDLAIELLTLSEAFPPERRPDYSELILQFEKSGNCELAIEVLKRAQDTRSSCSLAAKDIDSSSLKVDELARQLHEARKATRSNPLSTLSWLSLARSYTLLGLQNSLECERAILTAFQLAPNNRFVVRAAARYFIHRHLPDRAVELLLRSRRTAFDPWLASALVAAREIASAPQKSIFKYQRMASDDNWSMLARSELLAGLATIEAGSGSDKKAKALMVKALKEPTENSLAQAEWFSRHCKPIFIQETQMLNTGAFEAIEASAFEAGEWDKVVDSALRWQSVEPFSKRPALNGTMVALSVQNDPTVALKLMTPAFVSNRDDALVVNNYSVSLILDGQLEKARRVISAYPGGINDPNRAALVATEGLLHFRKGDLGAGRLHYEYAREIMRINNDRWAEFVCCIYWAREERRAGNDQASVDLIAQGKDRYKNYKHHKLANAILTHLD